MTFRMWVPYVTTQRFRMYSVLSIQIVDSMHLYRRQKSLQNCCDIALQVLFLLHLVYMRTNFFICVHDFLVEKKRRIMHERSNENIDYIYLHMKQEKKSRKKKRISGICSEMRRKVSPANKKREREEKKRTREINLKYASHTLRSIISSFFPFPS